MAMKTGDSSSIHSISITMSEEMFPTEPTEASAVSRQGDEDIANPLTSKLTLQNYNPFDHIIHDFPMKSYSCLQIRNFF